MPTRFTLRQLEYLVAVGQLRSVSLAAEQLNVSAPSVSTAITQLEAELGLPLFVRKHAHGLSPTQSGRELIREAAAVLAAAKRLTDLANLQTGMVRGDLNLGCLLTFAQILVPKLRRSFTNRYPDVSFRQVERHQPGLIEGLRDASIDIALTYDLAIPTDLEFVELAVLPPFAIFSEFHPLADRASVAATDLAEHPLVLLDLPLSAAYFLSIFDEAGLKPRIAERTQDMAVVYSLVANDFGYSIANVRPRSDRSPDGRKLRFVPMTRPVRPMRMGLLFAKGASSSLTIRAFVEHCQTLSSEGLLSDLIMPANGPAR